MSLREIATEGAPEAIGPYSQAVESDGWIFTAGQIGLDPRSGEFVGPDVESQARQVFANLRAVLAAAGAGFDDVVKATVFLADLDDYAAVNEVYAEQFSPPYPARSAVEASELPRGARVEVELVARAG